jgi:hypothetical protein
MESLLTDVPNWILFMVSNLVIAGAVYGGIRSDLKHMRSDIMRAEKVSEHAHSRIDVILAARQQAVTDRAAVIMAAPIHPDTGHRQY